MNRPNDLPTYHLPSIKKRGVVLKFSFQNISGIGYVAWGWKQGTSNSSCWKPHIGNKPGPIYGPRIPIWASSILGYLVFPTFLHRGRFHHNAYVDNLHPIGSKKGSSQPLQAPLPTKPSPCGGVCGSVWGGQKGMDGWMGWDGMGCMQACMYVCRQICTKLCMHVGSYWCMYLRRIT